MTKRPLKMCPPPLPVEIKSALGFLAREDEALECVEEVGCYVGEFDFRWDGLLARADADVELLPALTRLGEIAGIDGLGPPAAFGVGVADDPPAVALPNAALDGDARTARVDARVARLFTHGADTSV